MIAKYALWANQYIAVHFSDGFLSHMISYKNFILMVIVGSADKLFLSYDVVEDQPPTLEH